MPPHDLSTGLRRQTLGIYNVITITCSWSGSDHPRQGLLDPYEFPFALSVCLGGGGPAGGTLRALHTHDAREVGLFLAGSRRLHFPVALQAAHACVGGGCTVARRAAACVYCARRALLRVGARRLRLQAFRPWRVLVQANHCSCNNHSLTRALSTPIRPAPLV